jgi:hypothetical protein
VKCRSAIQVGISTLLDIFVGLVESLFVVWVNFFFHGDVVEGKEVRR